MSVVINEAALRRFMHDEAGPLNKYISRKADEVLIYAYNNAAPHKRSGDLLDRLHAVGPLQDQESIYHLVGSDATHAWKGHEPFNYPIALELGGVTPQGAYYRYPFLGPALRQAGFRQGA